eukprot:14569317-Ditylum_brightwellii.AAC.1
MCSYNEGLFYHQTQAQTIKGELKGWNIISNIKSKCCIKYLQCLKGEFCHSQDLKSNIKQEQKVI